MSGKKAIENLKVVFDFMVKGNGFDKCLEKVINKQLITFSP